MDALRRLVPFASFALASLTGCGLLGQLTPTTQNPKPTEQKNAHPPAEVVEKSPPAKAKVASEAEAEDPPAMSAIEQWAEQMAKRNEAKEAAGRRPTSRAVLDGRRSSSANALFAGNETPDDAGVRSRGGETSEGDERHVAATDRIPVERGSSKTNAAAKVEAPPRKTASADTEGNAPEPPAAKSPVLAGVNAAAGVQLPDGGGKAARAPSLNAAENASETSSTLKELLDRWLSQSGDNSFRQQLDRRVLCVLSGDYEKARQPLEMATKDQQAMAARFVEAMIAIHDGHGGEPGGEASRVLANVEQLREALLPTTELCLPAFAVCKSVKGFGQYEAFDPPQFTAGRENEFVAYCEIRDFVSDKRADGTFQSNFSMKIAVLNRSGDKVHEMAADEIIDRCKSRRRDCFLSPLVRLPATIAPGEYVVKVTIADKIGKKVAEKTATLRIVAKS